MKVKIPTVDQVIFLNQYICNKQGNPFAVLDRGKIESALHTAFYPGSYPFSAGAFTAVRFMNINGWDLQYVEQEENDNTAFANVIEKCAASEFGKEDLIEWFDTHKIKQ